MEAVEIIEAIKSKAVGDLKNMVGREFISTNRADLYIYSPDQCPKVLYFHAYFH